MTITYSNNKFYNANYIQVKKNKKLKNNLLLCINNSTVPSPVSIYACRFNNRWRRVSANVVMTILLADELIERSAKLNVVMTTIILSSACGYI